jgi:hypothetical protein
MGYFVFSWDPTDLLVTPGTTYYKHETPSFLPCSKAINLQGGPFTSLSLLITNSNKDARLSGIAGEKYNHLNLNNK